MNIYVTFVDHDEIEGNEVAKYRELGFEVKEHEHGFTISDKEFELKTLEEFEDLLGKIGISSLVWKDVKGKGLVVKVYNYYME